MIISATEKVSTPIMPSEPRIDMTGGANRRCAMPAACVLLTHARYGVHTLPEGRQPATLGQGSRVDMATLDARKPEARNVATVE